MDKEHGDTHTHTHTHNFLAIKRNPATCDSMDEPLGRYTKWNRSETQMLHIPTVMQKVKKLNS